MDALENMIFQCVSRHILLDDLNFRINNNIQPGLVIINKYRKIDSWLFSSVDKFIIMCMSTQHHINTGII